MRPTTFGKPRAWHEQLPSHPLFFFRSELAALPNHDGVATGLEGPHRFCQQTLLPLVAEAQ
jgi:hypothetical protein